MTASTAGVKLAVNWAGACGGCDVALLDAEVGLLDLAAAADIVYWPVALDFKHDHLAAFRRGEIDIGIYNGAVRTSDHLAGARLLRDRCRFLVAFGSCAAFGGIPALANLHSNRAVLDTAYRETPSTDNPDDVRPEPSTTMAGYQLSLPSLEPRVRSLHQVVDVDLIVPGCPPPLTSVSDVIALVRRYAEDRQLPPSGTVLASPHALCDDCPRIDTRTTSRMHTVHRPHLVVADPELCFLEQGIVCLGLATRSGCGASCITANMPCRGCFGPTAEMLDPAAEALSAIGSVAGVDHEDVVPATQRLAPVRSIRDLVGTFYRFTLATATFGGAVQDRPREPGECS